MRKRSRLSVGEIPNRSAVHSQKASCHGLSDVGGVPRTKRRSRKPRPADESLLMALPVSSARTGKTRAKRPQAFSGGSLNQADANATAWGRGPPPFFFGGTPLVHNCWATRPPGALCALPVVWRPPVGLLCLRVPA